MENDPNLSDAFNDEVRAVAESLVSRHGSRAHEEAVRLSDYAGQRLSVKSLNLYKSVAQHIEQDRRPPKVKKRGRALK